MNWFDKTLHNFRVKKHHLTQEYSNHLRFYRTFIFQSTEIINQKEIRVVGIRRTGNHAIIGWIRSQHPEYAFHINHPPAGQNPYQFLYTHFKTPELYQEAIGKFSQKSLLIISYEDQELEKIYSAKFEKFHDTYVGVSASQFDVLLLRDPFNLVASRIKSNKSSITDGSAIEAIELWKSYAREFVGETAFLKHNKLCINFNKWHYNAQYREEIAKSLELEFTDAGRERVRDYGGGSSFDGRKLDGQASQLDILNRWQLFADEDSFWHLFKDEELLYYIERIFDKETLPFHKIQLNKR
ncbi:MAG: hypothetical protein WA865_14620 [Spirulinaceae cyanobacterium]